MNTHARKWRNAAGRLILAGGILFPGVAAAQGEFFATPSITLAEVYDDNVFFAPSGQGREDDFISRFSPSLAAGFRSAPLTLIGRYTFDAEIYSRHSALTDYDVRREAAIDFVYRPTRLLTVSLATSYVETEVPSELNLETGLIGGRAEAERFSIAPSLHYRFDAVTSGAAAYTFTTDKLSGGEGVETDVHTAALGLDRRITRRDTASLGYTFRHFVFDRDDRDTHVATVGWTHNLTPAISLTLVGGPRISEGSVDPEILASVRHRLQRGELSFAYARSESTTALGEAGTVRTDTFEATATFSPDRFWELRAAPSLVLSKRGGFDTEVYRASLDVRYRATKWLSFIASYELSLQQGRLDRPGGGDIARNVVLLGIVLTAPSWPGFTSRPKAGRSVLPKQTIGPDGGITPQPGENR